MKGMRKRRGRGRGISLMDERWRGEGTRSLLGRL